jgi:hypothetical protein
MKTAIFIFFGVVGGFVLRALLNMLPSFIGLPIALLLLYTGIRSGYKMLADRREPIRNPYNGRPNISC